MSQQDVIQKILSRSDRKNLRSLLGEVIDLRMVAEDHHCHLLSLLENNYEELLAWYEKKCADFILAIQGYEKEAISKIRMDLAGPAQNCSQNDFNSKMADFFAEIAAVGELFRMGGFDFVPLIPYEIKKGHVQGAPDFKFRMKDQEGVISDIYLEVKNIRSPVGILETFRQIYSDLCPKHPRLLRCWIQLTHYCDDTVNKEWHTQIEDFMLDLARHPVAGSRSLTLFPNIQVDVVISSIEYNGGVTMVRGIGGENPDGPFINLEALKRKATDTVKKAMEQLSPYAKAKRMLALNISTADALLHQSIIDLLIEVVREQGEGGIELFLLHHHHGITANILQ